MNPTFKYQCASSRQQTPEIVVNAPATHAEGLNSFRNQLQDLSSSKFPDIVDGSNVDVDELRQSLADAGVAGERIYIPLTRAAKRLRKLQHEMRAAMSCETTTAASYTATTTDPKPEDDKEAVFAVKPFSSLALERASTSTGAVSSARPHGLLDLPFEVWAHICLLAVEDDHKPIIVSREPWEWSFRTGIASPRFVCATLKQPPLTRVCYAIRSETLQAWHRAHEFRFVDFGAGTQGLRGWVLAMREAGLWRHVGHVVLETGQGYRGVLSKMSYVVFGGCGVEIELVREGNGADVAEGPKVPYLVKTREMRQPFLLR